MLLNFIQNLPAAPTRRSRSRRRGHRDPLCRRRRARLAWTGSARAGSGGAGGEQTRTIGEWSVPQTEVLIVLKFLAAVSPWRARNNAAKT
jgi:hypothetical protein